MYQIFWFKSIRSTTFQPIFAPVKSFDDHFCQKSEKSQIYHVSFLVCWPDSFDEKVLFSFPRVIFLPIESPRFKLKTLLFGYFVYHLRRKLVVDYRQLFIFFGRKNLGHCFVSKIDISLASIFRKIWSLCINLCFPVFSWPLMSCQSLRKIFALETNM